MDIDLLVAGKALLVFALGLTLGSFGNVLVFRLPQGKSILGRSRCVYCQRTLQASDLLPVVSFLLLRGRCRDCQRPIPLRYPLLELFSGAVFVFAYLSEGTLSLPMILLALALWLLVLIATIDGETGGIPDSLNIPFVIVALLYTTITRGFPAVASLVGAGFFAFQWVISRGQWVGSGDIILGAGIGALLGTWPLTVMSIFLAYICGAMTAVSLLLQKRKTMEDALSFGPFLAIGLIVTLLVGDRLLLLF